MNVSRIRTAAILVAEMAPEHAQRLLALLTPAASSLLVRAVGELGEVPIAEREAAVARLVQDLARPSLPTGRSDLSPVSPAERAGEVFDPATRANSGNCGAGVDVSLDGETTELLAAALERERPQVIAAVLSRWSPAMAARVLRELCEDLRSDVLDRIGRLNPIASDVHGLLTTALEQSVLERRDERDRRDQGAAVVNAILAATPSHDGEELEHATVGDVRTRVQMAFADLAQLDDTALAAVLAAVSPQLVQVALMDAEPSFVDRARRLAPAVGKLPGHQGPLLLGDIARAQQALADEAARMIDNSDVVLVSGGRLSAAA
ncbi:MAG: hypothetical protein KDB14_18260 [Planctomycetales bacterium]|nr:hypothetical protein [Planctomycetales bacterium]